MVSIKPDARRTVLELEGAGHGREGQAYPRQCTCVSRLTLTAVIGITELRHDLKEGIYSAHVFISDKH